MTALCYVISQIDNCGLREKPLSCARYLPLTAAYHRFLQEPKLDTRPDT